MGSPLTGTVICGSSFGLKVRRHRVFESTFPIKQLECRHKEQQTCWFMVRWETRSADKVRGTYRKGGKTAETIEEARELGY